MRRLAVIFKKYGTHKLTCEESVGLMYQMLSEGDKVFAQETHNSNKIKPFTYAIDECEESMTFYFSSIKQKITKVFRNGAEKLKENNGGFPYGSCVYKVADIINIPDLQFIPRNIRVKTISPIALFYKSNAGKNKGKNKKVNLIYTPNTKSQWLDALIKNTLAKVSIFCNEDAELKLKCLPIKNGYASWIKFQEGTIIARHIELKLTGSKKAIECAVYGGLGAKTGMGFGMVMPC